MKPKHQIIVTAVALLFIVAVVATLPSWATILALMAASGLVTFLAHRPRCGRGKFDF